MGTRTTTPTNMERMIPGYWKGLVQRPSRRVKLTRFKFTKLYMGMAHIKGKYTNNENDQA